jgi:superfamily II DNA helicase RecQ
MQFDVFAVPASGSREMVETLNRFLRSRRVLHVERKLVENGSACYWSFCVEFLEGGSSGPVLDGSPKVDYKEVLTPEQFARFSALRTLRKELADREAVPPYAVFTNEQLAQMVRLESPTAAAMEQIAGIGPAKMARYGAVFLQALSGAAQKTTHETSGPPAGADR